ncbi:MAG: poly(3-hydroxyalkanoate) granule-associated protein PhaF, partial [Deltaproteobacteria bacterium]|nr:poly(3-hydroxyalkanoate) granule-associated protein PhaF [Deltaproteobacteria bacterium]
PSAAAPAAPGSPAAGLLDQARARAHADPAAALRLAEAALALDANDAQAKTLVAELLARKAAASAPSADAGAAPQPAVKGHPGSHKAAAVREPTAGKPAAPEKAGIKKALMD